MKLSQTKHKVRVTPLLNGNISNFEVRFRDAAPDSATFRLKSLNFGVLLIQTRVSPCPRTVLLTGIPDVMEQETLQDLLEIHFQKNRNGGGEIEAFLYNPAGRNASALFGTGSKERGDL